MTNIAFPTAPESTQPLDVAQDRWGWLEGLCIFLFGVIVAFLLLASNSGFVGNDDYYHARIAAQILEQGRLRVDFPWLPLTILSESKFVDHHLLYHLYLAPWAYWGGGTGMMPVAAIKIAHSLVIGAVFLAFWMLLRSLHVRYAPLWTLALLALSTPFLYRALMIRTQAAALLLLIVGLHLLFQTRSQRRYRWLIGLAFAFTWLYNGFVLFPAVAGLYAVAVFLTERRIEWKPVVYALIGMVLGLVINPYFPENIAFILDHLGEKVDIAGSVRVGSEWYPYDTAVLLENSLGAMLALAGGFLALSLRKNRRETTLIETTLLFAGLLTLYMVFRSRRFIEYFPAFALLFCAVSWGRSGVSLADYFPHVGVRTQKLLRYAIVLIGAIPLFLLARTTVTAVQGDIRSANTIDYLAGASAWLRENTEPGTMVFQTDWDDFPYLFYHNPQNTYLVGLDPTYLQVADVTLWNQWVAITQGRVENPSQMIRDAFNATYVVSDIYHDEFEQQAENDPNMRLVYRDGNSLVWEVISIGTEGN